MVSITNQRKALQFICDRLEESGLYLLQQKGKMIEAAESVPSQDTPRNLKVILANGFTQAEFEQGLASNRRQGVYVAPVLYNDGKTAFVRMVDRNISWRKDKSLKRHTYEEISQMRHLRRIEKVILDQFENPLTYYQPETDNLPESLRVLRMDPVRLDYSHIGPEDQGYEFVENRESIDYKLPVNVATITRTAHLELFPQPDIYKRARIVGA